MRDFGEILGDPDERAMIVPFLSGRATDADRHAYLAWLDARRDPRAEVLRLALAAAADRASAADRTRLRALRPDVDPRWWQMIQTRGWTLNCGAARDQPRVVRFAYECERAWEELDPTGDPAVRACDRCTQPVFACATMAEAEDHARRGHCISVAPALAGQIHTRFVAPRAITGRPHPPTYWARALFADDDR